MGPYRSLAGWRGYAIAAAAVADRVVTSRMLLEQVWGPGYETDTQALRVHVSHLRQKIEPACGVPHYILTEPGVGFRFIGGV